MLTHKSQKEFYTDYAIKNGDPLDEKSLNLYGQNLKKEVDDAYNLISLFAGLSPIPYSNTTEYNVGEIVSHNGVNYICEKVAYAIEPPNSIYWRVLDSTVIASVGLNTMDNYISKTNQTEYNPEEIADGEASANYHPATVKFVEERIDYALQNKTITNSDRLDGFSSEYFASKQELTDLEKTISKADTSGFEPYNLPFDITDMNTITTTSASEFTKVLTVDNFNTIYNILKNKTKNYFKFNSSNTVTFISSSETDTSRTLKIGIDGPFENFGISSGYTNGSIFINLTLDLNTNTYSNLEFESTCQVVISEHDYANLLNHSQHVYYRILQDGYLLDCRDILLTQDSTDELKFYLTWKDPGDRISSETTTARFAGTKVVTKVGSEPENVDDGTLIVDSKVRDAYSINALEITVTSGDKTYIKLFPYADNGNITNDSANVKIAHSVSEMTCIIDESVSDPSKMVTLSGDASGKTRDELLKFIGYYPCLFVNGQEAGTLNPDDYTKYSNSGGTADITTLGNDVMVAFPRRGLKISKVDKKITISFTDNPSDPNYYYYAHTKNGTSGCVSVTDPSDPQYRTKFYFSAYEGFVSSNKLYSSSGRTPTVTGTIGTYRGYATNRGSGYEIQGYFQTLFIQAAYVLCFQNLNSQVTISRGLVDYSWNNGNNPTGKLTGSANQYGPNCEIIKASNASMANAGTGYATKLFGIENLWGSIWTWMDGLGVGPTWGIMVANGGYNDSKTGYENIGPVGGTQSGVYFQNVFGDSKGGFVPKMDTITGSDNTYYCDMYWQAQNTVAKFGGRWNYASDCGVFYLALVYSSSDSASAVGSRLQFL